MAVKAWAMSDTVWTLAENLLGEPEDIPILAPLVRRAAVTRYHELASTGS